MMAATEICTSSTDVTKKRKIEDGGAFKDFELVKVLRVDDRNKMINLHGLMPRSKTSTDTEDAGGDGPDQSDAVIVLERKPFDPKDVERCIRGSNCFETLQNDIYTTFDLNSFPETSGEQIANTFVIIQIVLFLHILIEIRNAVQF